MKFSSSITGSLKVATRQAGGGLQAVMNWHLLFTEGVTKGHQGAAAEPVLDCESANELANPYSWVGDTESVYFSSESIQRYCCPCDMSKLPIWTRKPRLSHPSRRACSPDRGGPLPPPSLQTLAMEQGASVLISNRQAWYLTWWEYRIFEYTYKNMDKKNEKKNSNQYR